MEGKAVTGPEHSTYSIMAGWAGAGRRSDEDLWESPQDKLSAFLTLSKKCWMDARCWAA